MGKRKRITKKDLKRDALLESASKTTKFIEEHRNAIMVALVVVLGVVAATNLALRARRATEHKANAALVTAVQSLNSGLIAQAEEQLQSVATDFAGTHSASAAVCYLGTVYFRQGKYDDALAQFETYLNHHRATPTLRRIALEGKAAVLEQQRDFAAAAQIYTQLAQDAKTTPSTYSRYLLDAARCYRSQRDWQSALRTAELILQTYPDSPLAPDARLAAAEARAHLSG